MNNCQIVIAGAGIGGLSAALSLHAAGFTNVKLIESATEFKPLGVGLNVLPNAVRELDDLGLLEELERSAIRTKELLLVNRFGTKIWSEPRGEEAGYRWPQLSIPRRHLQKVLLDAVERRLGHEAIRSGVGVTGWTEEANGRVQVQTSDGQDLPCDMLVGADGIHSQVRKTLFPDDGGPRLNGMVMWRGTSWAPRYLSGATMVVAGDDIQRMVFYPIAPHPDRPSWALINWVAARPQDAERSSTVSWRKACDTDTVLRHFGDFEFDWLRPRAIIEASIEVYEYPMADLDPLDRWSVGPVTLLGDAAHAMYPNGSNGATQAIIDGRVLAQCLVESEDVEQALVSYDARRRPAMTQLQGSNRARGPESVITVAHQRAPKGFAHVRDVLSAEELAACSNNYAVIGGFDLTSVNSGPTLRPALRPHRNRS